MSDLSETPDWRIAGDWFDNCSCAVACPCTFAQTPDNGYCDFVLFWHVNQGHYGDIELNDLSLVRIGRWEGDMWGGNASSEGGVFVDERASDAQAEALQEIFSGRAGGWPADWASLFPEGRKIHGTERAQISFEIAPDLAHWGVEILGRVKAWAKAITGPTSPTGTFPQLLNAPGAETGPNPKPFTWGKSTTCSVDAFGFNFSWTVSSAKHAPFDWSGP
jgi:hypothetical protein